MAGYILRRLAATLPVMLIVALFVFLMLRLTPGDPAAIIAGDNANAEQIALIRNRLGLDEPIICAATSANRSSSRRPSPS
jgi:peptide/nickel transport system permease protein